MGQFYGGIDASLTVDGARIGRARSWTIQADAKPLETTTLGDSAPTFIYGRQSYSGQCVVLYYANEAGSIEGKTLFGSLLQTGVVPPNQKYNFRLASGDRSVEFSALITSCSLQASQGDVMSASVAFVVDGLLTEASLGGS